MVLSEENISPEEKLLKVIKGTPAPVPPRLNPFAGSGPIVPPLSDVLASIIGRGAGSSTPAQVPSPTVAESFVKPVAFIIQLPDLGRWKPEVTGPVPVIPVASAASVTPVTSSGAVPVVLPFAKILEMIDARSVISLPEVQAVEVSRSPVVEKPAEEPVIPIPVLELPLPVLEPAPVMPVSAAVVEEARSEPPVADVPMPVLVAPEPVGAPGDVPVVQDVNVGVQKSEVACLPADVSDAAVPVVAVPVEKLVDLVPAVDVQPPVPDVKPVVPTPVAVEEVRSEPPVADVPMPVLVAPEFVEAPVAPKSEAGGRRAEAGRPAPIEEPVAVVAETSREVSEATGPKTAVISPAPVSPRPKLAPVPVAIPPPATSVVPPARPVVPPVEEKTKLKVVKTEAPGTVSAKPEIPAPAPVKVDKKQLQDMAKTKAALAEDSVDHVIPPPVVIAKKVSEKKKFGINNVNIGLAAAALLLIAVSVNEVFDKMRSDELLCRPFSPAGQKPPDSNAQGAGDGLRVPPLEMLIQGLGDRPVLAMSGQRAKETPVAAGGTEQAPQVVDWMKYAQDSLKLMGFSGGGPDGSLQSAIVQEGKDKDAKLHFLKAGQKFPIQGHEILIENVKDDQVFMTDGKRKMTIR